MPPATRPIVFSDERDAGARRAARAVAGPSCGARWRRCAAAFKAMGVQRGDRVCARHAQRAARPSSSSWPRASLGAIWSVCSPDMGPVAVLDRFRQIEPKLLVACDGYRYGGVAHDRRALLQQLLAELPTVQHAVLWRSLDAERRRAGAGRRVAPGARPGRAAGRTTPPFAPELAALRPPAVGGVFQRHHRAAQADRARPRRHHARGAEARHAAQRRRPQRR